MVLGHEGHKTEYPNTPSAISAFHYLPQPYPNSNPNTWCTKEITRKQEKERERERGGERKRERRLPKCGFGMPKLG